jgi:hypothetical protein
MFLGAAVRTLPRLGSLSVKGPPWYLEGLPLRGSPGG